MERPEAINGRQVIACNCYSRILWRVYCNTGCMEYPMKPRPGFPSRKRTSVELDKYTPFRAWSSFRLSSNKPLAALYSSLKNLPRHCGSRAQLPFMRWKLRTMQPYGRTFYMHTTAQGRRKCQPSLSNMRLADTRTQSNDNAFSLVVDELRCDRPMILERSSWERCHGQLGRPKVGTTRLAVISPKKISIMYVGL